MKKIITIALLCGIMLTSCANKETFETYDYSYYPDNVSYNKDPDISSKATAAYKTELKAELYNVGQCRSFSDALVVARILDDGKEGTYKEDAIVVDGETILEEHTFLCTFSEAEIIHSVYGELSEKDTISVFQRGEPGVNDEQVKLKKGDVVLLMLSKREDGTYKLTDGEESCFYINDDFSVTSMSVDLVCAKYDGLQLSILITDIENSEE